MGAGKCTLESAFYERKQAPLMDPAAPASWVNCETSILIRDVSSLDCNFHFASPRLSS